MKPFLSIIIPAHNEEKQLPLTLIDIDRFLREADYSYEVVIVDSDSTDSTSKIIERFKRFFPYIKSFRGGEGKGEGYAVRIGMLSARGNYRLFMSAHNSVPVGEWNAMIPLLRSGYDAVVGSRYLKGSAVRPRQSLGKRFWGEMGRRLVGLVLLPEIKDARCDFKCFKEEAAEEIFKRLTLEGWGFDLEALSIARFLGFKIKEIPVSWNGSRLSEAKLGTFLAALRGILAIRLNLWLHRYKKS